MIGVITHCKYVDVLAPNNTIAVSFNDWQGNPLNCNYIQVDISGTNTMSGFLLVEPSGVSNYPRVALGNGVSGTFGFEATVREPNRIVLSHGKTAKGVFITNNFNVTTGCIVTYVVATPMSFFKSKLRSPGI